MQFSLSELLTLAPELFVLSMASIILVVEAFVGRERSASGPASRSRESPCTPSSPR